jgi:hypothetical protein
MELKDLRINYGKKKIREDEIPIVFGMVQGLAGGGCADRHQ